jgi:hypothetical protein
MSLSVSNAIRFSFLQFSDIKILANFPPMKQKKMSDSYTKIKIKIKILYKKNKNSPNQKN